MKIKLYGEPNNSWYPSQLPLIKKGLLELDHELVDRAEDSQILYCNDPNGYEQICDDKIKTGKPAALLIHDIPEYQANYKKIAMKYWEYANLVDAVAVNSVTTQNQVKRLIGMDSFVVYQPAKEIIPLNLEKQNEKLRFLYVGRAASQNKRFFLVKELIQKYYDEKQLVVVGSENPGFGNYVGIVDDGQLCVFYNMADFVLIPSGFEGLGLPGVESILAGKPPIVCNDCSASMEFLPDFACDPNIDAMHEKIQEIQNNPRHWNWVIQQYARKFDDQLSYRAVTQNISDLLESL